MSSPEEDAFGQWMIVFDPARLLIGRVDPVASEGKSYMVLCPCYELIDNKIATNDGRILNLVQVQPIAACLFDVPVIVSDGGLTCIDLNSIDRHDRIQLRTKIEELQKQLVEKRSGIKLVAGGARIEEPTKH